MTAIGDPTYLTDLDDLVRVKWVNGVALTSDLTTSSTTELLLMTVPSMTYEADTAYKVEIGGLVRVSVASNSPMFQLRKTNAAGTLISGNARWPVIPASTNHGFSLAWHFQVGGSAVAAALAVTLTGSGAYTATVPGSVEPAWANVYKVESAANMSWAKTLS